MMLSGNELSAEQRLHKAVVDIMHNPMYTALAGVLLMGTNKIVDIPEAAPGKPFTAMTNGRDAIYGKDFVGWLNDAELRFLVLHETYHKLYRHFITWKHLKLIDKECASEAMDQSINLKLYDDNHTTGWATMPKGGCMDQRFRLDSGAVMDTAQIFHIIYQEKPKGGQGKGKGEQGQGQGQDQGQGGGKGGMDEHDWEGAEEMTPEEVKQLSQDIDQAVRQGALAAGKGAGDLSEDMRKLLTPQVDWRKVMREFITDTCSGSDYGTWSRPNRRFIGAGYYMPSGVSERVRELVIAGDLSGSCWGAIPNWITEIKSVVDMVKPDKIHILFWDSKVETCAVYDPDMTDSDTLIKGLDIRGGGGTDIGCVPKYLTKHGINPQAVVVLTDGYLYDGWHESEWKWPLLTCLVNNDSCRPPVGKYVHIKEGDI